MMTDRAEKEARQKFRALLNAASVLDDIDRDHLMLGRGYGRNNAVLGWNHQPYQDAIDVVQRLYPRVSKRTIGNALTDSMVRLFEEEAVREDASPDVDAHVDSILGILREEAIRQEVSRCLEFLRYQVERHTVFVPLEGLKLKSSKQQIADIILYSSRGGPLIPIMEKLGGTKYGRKVAESLQETFEEAGCYVTIDAEGDSEFAVQQALRDAEDVVHILNLYLGACRDRAIGYMKIGVVGQPVTTHRQDILHVTPPLEEAQEHKIGFKGKRPRERRYEISGSKVRQWEGQGLDKVIESFKHREPKPTTIKSRIQRSVTWHSKAVNGGRSDEQFVALAIALESLLVGDEGVDPKVSWGSITQRLAERVAFLLGDDYERRVYFEAETKRLYRLRSRIVHQGLPVSRENLDLLDCIVGATIVAFVTREFGSWTDVLTWEKEQKYGSPQQREDGEEGDRREAAPGSGGER